MKKHTHQSTKMKWNIKQYKVWIAHAIVRKTLFLSIVAIAIIIIFFPIGSLISGESVMPKMFGDGIPISDPHNAVLAIEIREISDRPEIDVILNTIILPKTSSHNSNMCVSIISIEKIYDYSLNSKLREPRISDLWDFGDTRVGISIPFGYQTRFAPFCSSENDITLRDMRDISVESGRKTISLDTNSTSPFFFPFDRKFISFVVVLDSEYDKPIAPDVIGLIQSKEWDKKVVVTELPVNKIEGTIWGMQDNLIVSLVEVSFIRPLAYRVLIPTLIVVLAIVIMSTLYLESLGDFLQVMIGILLGLWGLKSALIPNNILSPTMVDGLILGLYVLLAIFLVFRFTLKPLWHKWID